MNNIKSQETIKYIGMIEEYINKNYRTHFHDPAGLLKHHYFESGINYSTETWDWGSWQNSISLNAANYKDIEKYEKGTLLNFLDRQDSLGRIPILISATKVPWLPDLDENYQSNIAKPVMFLHALEISKHFNDVQWIKPYYNKLVKFINYYDNNLKHNETGLFYFVDDFATGLDNEPSVFYRPDKSTGSLFLNCLMYQELLAAAELSHLLKENKNYEDFKKRAEKLKKAIQNECYDEVDGYYYSADISLKPVNPNHWLHSGCPRHWKSLPIKVNTWTGMLALWANIATKEQAERIVKRYLDKEGLFSPFGIRSLDKRERMYRIVSSNNPSCNLGPVWINFNYFVYIGLKNYGYTDLADDIAVKTITLLGKDLETNGGFHEYYDPDTGKGIHGLGFLGWNQLVMKLIADLKDELVQY